MTAPNRDELIDRMAAFTAPNVFNPWRDVDPLDLFGHAHLQRQGRLRCHFDCDPEFVLIGEAPGYQGCHFSGVPFTNEKLILDGRVPRCGPVFSRLTSRDKPWSEPSATIVWSHLHDLGIADRTVMWNAFAWHPHKPGEPMSNRAPTRAELEAGAGVLTAVLRYFIDAKFIAVGAVAHSSMRRLGVTPNHVVRHPSMGGANKFREQMTRLIKRSEQLA